MGSEHFNQGFAGEGRRSTASPGVTLGKTFFSCASPRSPSDQVSWKSASRVGGFEVGEKTTEKKRRKHTHIASSVFPIYIYISGVGRSNSRASSSQPVPTGDGENRKPRLQCHFRASVAISDSAVRLVAFNIRSQPSTFFSLSSPGASCSQRLFELLGNPSYDAYTEWVLMVGPGIEWQGSNGGR